MQFINFLSGSLGLDIKRPTSRYAQPNPPLKCLIYLEISDQQRANEAIVETLEFITHIVVACLAHNILNASHQVIHKLEGNTL